MQKLPTEVNLQKADLRSRHEKSCEAVNQVHGHFLLFHLKFKLIIEGMYHEHCIFVSKSSIFFQFTVPQKQI